MDEFGPTVRNFRLLEDILISKRSRKTSSCHGEIGGVGGRRATEIIPAGVTVCRKFSLESCAMNIVQGQSSAKSSVDATGGC